LLEQTFSFAFSTYRANRLLFLGVDAQPKLSLKLHERHSGVGRSRSRSRFSQAPSPQANQLRVTTRQQSSQLQPPATGQQATASQQAKPLAPEPLQPP
jgi:hypothetical protein